MKHLLAIAAVSAALLWSCASSGNKTTDTEIAMLDTVDVFDSYDVMVGHNTDRPVVYLIFSADSMFEGAPKALDALDERGIKANFFFTGNFLERPENESIVRRVIDSHHYVGGHSNRHILLADWAKGRPILVPEDSMLADIRANLKTLATFGIEADSCRWFLPPFEWIGPGQAKVLTDSLGLRIINPSPGIQTYRDYTTPDMAEYASSDSIINQLFDFERRNSLNGSFVIIHLGTQDMRTDKFYDHMPMVLDSLSSLGYSFERLY